METRDSFLFSLTGVFLVQWILHDNINASIDALLNKQPMSVAVNRITVDLETGNVVWEKALYPTLAEVQGE
jgi:hypothetical protein